MTRKSPKIVCSIFGWKCTKWQRKRKRKWNKSGMRIVCFLHRSVSSFFFNFSWCSRPNALKSRWVFRTFLWHSLELSSMNSKQNLYLNIHSHTLMHTKHTWRWSVTTKHIISFHFDSLLKHTKARAHIRNVESGKCSEFAANKITWNNKCSWMKCVFIIIIKGNLCGNTFECECVEMDGQKEPYWRWLPGWSLSRIRKGSEQAKPTHTRKKKMRQDDGHT